MSCVCVVFTLISNCTELISLDSRCRFCAASCKVRLGHIPSVQGRIQDVGMGAQVEPRRREHRGATGADGGRVWGGDGCPLRTYRALPPPQKNCSTFWLGMVHFGVYSDTISQFARYALSRSCRQWTPLSVEAITSHAMSLKFYHWTT